MWEAQLLQADVLSIRIFSSYFLHPVGAQERTPARSSPARNRTRCSPACREQLWQAAGKTEQGPQVGETRRQSCVHTGHGLLPELDRERMPALGGGGEPTAPRPFSLLEQFLEVLPKHTNKQKVSQLPGAARGQSPC